jgi:3-oxoacyl-[acyl-carrier protein] reductase
MDLAGKVAIVTGGGRGIGRVIALALAREGAEVVVAARTENEIEAVASEIADGGGTAAAIRVDVSREASIQAMVSKVLETMGSVHVLINNAGTHGAIKEIVNTTTEEWDRAIAVNLTGPFICCREVLPEMTKNGFGKIINMAAGGSRIGVKKYAAYCASKAGLVRLTESIAEEVRPYSVQAYALEPRGIFTSMREESRADGLQLSPGRPAEDILPAVLFLLSDEASYLSGKFIHMDEVWRWS